MAIIIIDYGHYLNGEWLLPFFSHTVGMPYRVGEKNRLYLMNRILCCAASAYCH